MSINEKFVVVGAGFFGAVVAERIAGDLGREVLVIDKRSHIGGNCYSETDAESGIEYHKYGTHIFHTSNQEVWDYLSPYFTFNTYYHQVLTTHAGKVYQMPVNLETMNSFFGVSLKPYEVESFLEQRKTTRFANPSNFEEAAINQLGEELYNAFIRGYTSKQWGRNPREIPASILSRLPFRRNYNESYYFDKWQGIPAEGYTSIFKKLLSHPKIRLELDTDFFKIRESIPPGTKIIFSGPIDQFFDYKYGRLEWRSLEFRREFIEVEDYQGTSVMNYADEEIAYTRIHEPKHLHPDREAFKSPATIIFKEYPCIDTNEPYYPVRDDKNLAILENYLKEAAGFPELIIGGRLGEYKYYDMDQTIMRALETYQWIKHG